MKEPSADAEHIRRFGHIDICSSDPSAVKSFMVLTPAANLFIESEGSLTQYNCRDLPFTAYRRAREQLRRAASFLPSAMAELAFSSNPAAACEAIALISQCWGNRSARPAIRAVG